MHNMAYHDSAGALHVYPILAWRCAEIMAQNRRENARRAQLKMQRDVQRGGYESPAGGVLFVIEGGKS
jgi:hypothetical protein